PHADVLRAAADPRPRFLPGNRWGILDQPPGSASGLPPSAPAGPMTSRIRSRVLTATLCMAVLAGGRSARAEEPAAQAPSPEGVEFFETHIRPLLADRCFKCHGEQKQNGGLRLDGRSLTLAGGDSGPAIVPGQPAQSLLIEAIHYDPAGYQMPPDGKLPDKQIALIERWVAMGAPWPPDQNIAAAEDADFDLQARAQRWSFQPLR